MQRTSGGVGSLVSPLVLTEEEAARALKISVRKLADMRRRGEVPFMRLGGRVVYPITYLETWISENVAG